MKRQICEAWLCLAIMLHLACAHEKPSLERHIPEGTYLNASLDYIQVAGDTLMLSDAFALAPCVFAYRTQGDTLVAEVPAGIPFPDHVSEVCTSKASVKGAVHGDVHIQYPRSQGCPFCIFEGWEYFMEERDFFKTNPWDSILIRRVSRQGLPMYELRVLASGRVEARNAALGLVSASSIKGQDALMRELGYIREGQFRLWGEGETSDSGQLAWTVYGEGGVDRYQGYMLPAYFKNLRHFLTAEESKLLPNFQ